jgi:hypothetical protein
VTYRPASPADPAKADMSRPEAKQIRAGNDTPGAAPVVHRIKTRNSIRMSLMDSDPVLISRNRVNHTGVTKQSGKSANGDPLPSQRGRSSHKHNLHACGKPAAYRPTIFSYETNEIRGTAEQEIDAHTR